MSDGITYSVELEGDWLGPFEDAVFEFLIPRKLFLSFKNLN